MENPKTEIRDLDEIQRAHDQLVGILTGATPRLTLDEESLQHLNIAATVLCWVLKHNHNDKFAKVIAELDAELLDLGYAFSRHNN